MTADSGTRALATAALVGVLVLSATLSVPLADARPAHEIPVSDDPAATLDGPNAAGWEEVPAADVPLASAPSSVPNAGDTSVDRIHVQAARSDGELHLRLRWEDPTRNTSAASPRAFADAVAVQFPADTSSRPPIAMGGADNRVNVWYWSADAGTQEVLAGGAGSTTPFESPTVDANATYEDGTWTVVYDRELAVEGENRTDLDTDDDSLDVAFAVWDGGNGERSGQKAVSEWYYFPTGEGEGGPPYQTLLWTVAGIAVVAVVAVTAFGVLRAQGGSDG